MVKINCELGGLSWRGELHEGPLFRHRSDPLTSQRRTLFSFRLPEDSGEYVGAEGSGRFGFHKNSKFDNEYERGFNRNGVVGCRRIDRVYVVLIAVRCGNDVLITDVAGVAVCRISGG